MNRVIQSEERDRGDGIDAAVVDGTEPRKGDNNNIGDGKKMSERKE